MKIYRYLLIFACFLPLLIFRDFTPNNELKYLSIADEALRDGHFFAFWNHGAVYADKPPLYLWIVMLGKWLFGNHYMLFLSLFSMIPALFIIYIMDKWVRNSLSSPSRLSGQLILITSGLFAGSAIVLRMDMLMCLFIVLALYTFYKQYTGQGGRYAYIQLPVYIFLSVFTKGPVGLLVPLLSIPCFLLWKKQIRDISKYLGGKQWGILLSLCVLWFGAVYLEGGKTYLNNLLFHQTVNRAVDAFHHKAPLWYYLKTIWYSLAPWILLYATAIFLGIKKKLINNDLKRFFLTVITTTFVALSLFSGKLDIYLLPIFPFIAYLAFVLLPELPVRQLRFTIAIPAILLLLAFPAIFIIAPYIPFPLLQYPFIPVAIFILSFCSGWTLYYLFKNKFSHSTNTLAIGILLTILVGGMTIPQLNSYMGFREMSQKAITLAHENGIQNYYFYKFRSGENIDAYLNQNISPLTPEEIVSLKDKQNFILFVKNKDVKKDEKIRNIIKDLESYSIGDYSIIIFQFN